MKLFCFQESSLFSSASSVTPSCLPEVPRKSEAVQPSVISRSAHRWVLLETEGNWSLNLKLNSKHVQLVGLIWVAELWGCGYEWWLIFPALLEMGIIWVSVFFWYLEFLRLNTYVNHWSWKSFSPVLCTSQSDLLMLVTFSFRTWDQRCEHPFLH